MASESPAVAFVESAEWAVLWVTRTGPTDKPCSVHYATTEGTATAGEDFVATSGVLQFAKGKARECVRVKLIDDDVPEDDEVFTVALSSPSLGYTLGDEEVEPVEIIRGLLAAVAPATKKGSLSYSGEMPLAKGESATTQGATTQAATLVSDTREPRECSMLLQTSTEDMTRPRRDIGRIPGPTASGESRLQHTLAVRHYTRGAPGFAPLSAPPLSLFPAPPPPPPPPSIAMLAFFLGCVLLLVNSLIAAMTKQFDDVWETQHILVRCNRVQRAWEAILASPPDSSAKTPILCSTSSLTEFGLHDASYLCLAISVSSLAT